MIREFLKNVDGFIGALVGVILGSALILGLFREFVKNEDGFIGSLIGGILTSGLIGGGTGAKIASVAGGALLDRQGRKQADQSSPRNRILSTVQGAKEAGIHPLEALRSGIGGSNMQSAPRVASQAVMQNTFDQMAAERQSRERSKERQEELEHALEVERIRSGRARIGNPRLISKTPAPDGGERPVDVLPTDNMSPNTMTGNDGSTYTVGPDTPGPDELLGWGLTTMPQRWAQNNPETNAQIRQGASDVSDNSARLPPVGMLGRLPHLFVDTIDHVYDTFGDPEKDPNKIRNHRGRHRK
jgi:hypothetical protein